MAIAECEHRLKHLDRGEEEEDGNSVSDKLIDLLPFEMHVPGYKFCGPGTKLAERIQRGDSGINPLDEACRQHDLAYNTPKINRRQADRILAEYAFSRMLAGETPPDERTVAMMTACCMVSKITFEKLFSRIKKAITRGKKKEKKSKSGEVKKKSKSGDVKKKSKSVEVKMDKRLKDKKERKEISNNDDE